MTANELLDFLCQENMRLCVRSSGEILIWDGTCIFGWFKGSNSVNVYRGNLGLVDFDKLSSLNLDNFDCFSISSPVKLLIVLHYIKDYRKDKGE